VLKSKNIILRDFIETDIEKRIYWETVETEWQLWDAPWEYAALTETEKADDLKSYIKDMQLWVKQYRKDSDEQKRYTFQIVTNNEEQKYIGWVSSYKIDADYNYSKEQGFRAVGIDIPDPSAQGKGYSYQALGLFIRYLLDHDEDDIYTQTWSGNERMIHIAEKIGFEECCRKEGIRSVGGRRYDGLTFRLNKVKYEKIWNTRMEEKMYNEKDIIAKWNAEMYDRNETDTEDVDFALSVIGNAPKYILEIACGSGRFLVPMANVGHNVVGLDFDEYMLNKIDAKIRNTENIKWYKSDVVRDEWGTGFDVVVLGANFLCNIVSELDYESAQKEIIQKAADALVLGGHVFIDFAYTFWPEKWFSDPEPRLIWQGEDSEGNFGKMELLDNTFDKETCMIKCVRRFELTLADGTYIVQEIPTEKHFVCPEQVREWLEQAGFTIEFECGDYQGNPISEKTSRAIIWARKG